MHRQIIVAGLALVLTGGAAASIAVVRASRDSAPVKRMPRKAAALATSHPPRFGGVALPADVRSSAAEEEQHTTFARGLAPIDMYRRFASHLTPEERRRFDGILAYYRDTMHDSWRALDERPELSAADKARISSEPELVARQRIHDELGRVWAEFQTEVSYDLGVVAIARGQE